MTNIELELIENVKHALENSNAKCFPKGGIAHAKVLCDALISGPDHCVSIKKAMRDGIPTFKM